MDLETEKWHLPILEEFGINEAILPKIASNCEVYGHVHSGPLAGVPIAGSLGDQQASLLGQQNRKRLRSDSDHALTSCRSLVQRGRGEEYIRHRVLSPPQHRDASSAFDPWPHYWSRLQTGTAGFHTVYVRGYPRIRVLFWCVAVSGSVAMAGSIFSWLRDNFGLIQSVEEVEDLANSVEDTGGVYCVPAFSGLLAPHWRDDARGVLIGLTGGFRIRASSEDDAVGQDTQRRPMWCERRWKRSAFRRAMC